MLSSSPSQNMVPSSLRTGLDLVEEEEEEGEEETVTEFIALMRVFTKESIESPPGTRGPTGERR